MKWGSVSESRRHTLIDIVSPISETIPTLVTPGHQRALCHKPARESHCSNDSERRLSLLSKTPIPILTPDTYPWETPEHTGQDHCAHARTPARAWAHIRAASGAKPSVLTDKQGQPYEEDPITKYATHIVRIRTMCQNVQSLSIVCYGRARRNDEVCLWKVC